MAFALPLEIIRTIGWWLPQQDLLHFAYTCQDVYRTVHDQIYEVIIIGSSKDPYGPKCATFPSKWRTEGYMGVSEPVFIRSLFSLMRFLETMVRHPDYARFICNLVAKDYFPDIAVCELHRYLRFLFPRLVNLQVLHWYSVKYPIQDELLQLLPSPSILLDMCGNFLLHPQGLNNEFVNLRHVDFSNVGSANALGSWTAGSFVNLESLTLSRTASSGTEKFGSNLSGCCKNMMNSNKDNLVTFWSSGKPPKYISKMFGSGTKNCLHLQSLTLRDIVVTVEDARLLHESICVSSLKHVSLDNCFEFYDQEPIIPNQVQIRRRTPPPITFIQIFFENIKNLESLKLGLFNQMNYNIKIYEAISKIKGIEKLSIHIKHFCTSRPIDLAPLVNSILAQKETLRYLSICSDVTEQFGAASCSKKINRYNLSTVAGISGLRKLKVLLMPVAISQINDLAHILSPMDELKIVHFLVTDSGTALTPRSCNGCQIQEAFSLCGSNSLIASEYFDCAGSFAANIKEERNQQYQKFAFSYRRVVRSLSHLRFDLKAESLVFDCETENAITSKDHTYIQHFDSLIQQQCN